jgi:glycerophosphoryl diester phosphodiesterase
MKTNPRVKGLVYFGAVSFGTGLYLLNASWLASPPQEQTTIIAQRGLHQVYGRDGVDDETCTARRIAMPAHQFIDNTLPSITAAFSLGADVVEIDVRLTKDGSFMLFHDASLECRTSGTGSVSEHTVAELKSFDVGYGYTADNGRSFPLRGLGIGLMPTLEETLKAFPQSRFLIQIKDGDTDVADRMVAYMEDRGLARWDQLAFFGSSAPLQRLKSMRPRARVWSAHSSAHCLLGYLELGWMNHVPAVCDDAIIIVPLAQRNLVWGWPYRFLTRMREHRTEVMLIGRIDGLSGANFSRLDATEEVSLLPAAFDGSIWTDRIDVIGRALKDRANPF